MKKKIIEDSKSNQRNQGIDLLRLILMFMICILHVLGQGGVLSSCEIGTTKYAIFWLLEVFSYYAANSFAFISGYMAKDKPQKYEKIVDMWFQVFFYSFIITLILTIFGFNSNWSIKSIIKSMLPITFNTFWYFTSYFILFLAMPILNKFLFSVDEKTAKKSLIIIVILFSIINLLKDPFKLIKGYSAFWLIILYCIGIFAKKIKLFENKKNITLIMLWIICILGSWSAFIFFKFNKLINYTSPTILLSGIIMVILFSRIKLKGELVSKVSSFAFGIYLFHLNPIIWNKIIKGAFSFIVTKNIFVGV